ncbi:flagellar hook protein FliD [Pseudoalteromonas phenolica]|uniref:Flagellar hook-associated protein 2 n=1 Tax=Pseudoalteromonas phenolica TaxID=161398 RepID=A0A5R9Q116_9GAMM|nr:flagellar filament capping protein FliD [Pseudoalteromonas phenolica]TLX45939.1 flagellar hook protein FliD [Pseudoalteromonas phenolica]
MSISFTGIGSGLQVNEIVTALVNAEKAPYQARVTRQQAQYTTDISAVGAMKGALEDIAKSLEGLGDIDEYQKRSISGSDDFVSVSSEKTAQLNTYSVKVNELAQNHKILSDGFVADTPVGEGTLTLSSGTNSFEINVSDTATLEEVRDAINDSEDNTSINATIVTDDAGQRLVLSSKSSGADNEIKVVVDDIDGTDTDTNGLSKLAFDSDAASSTFATNMTETTAATDASITIDGTVVVSSSTNEFKDVIDGITINVKKKHDTNDDLSELKVTENNKNVEAGISSFIEKFNAYIDLAAQLGRSGEDGAGAMAGDSLLRGTVSQLRNLVTREFSTGNGNTEFLANLGVRTERDGKLSLDKDQLQEAIDADPNAVQTFFLGENGDDGFVANLTSVTEVYTESDGIMQTRIDGRESQLDRLEKEVESFNLKMSSYEARLLEQYNSMDLLVSGLNSTGAYLQQQLSNLPGVVKQSK